MRPRSMLAGVLLLFALTAATACDDTGSAPSAATAKIPQATPAQLAAANLDELPLASDRARVDLAMPTFSNPTSVTNVLFPISELHSAILSGEVEGRPFHTETTLLPETRVIEWPQGKRVETLVSQYVAYIDGRIEEVALDHYAQADDGSVWYFGEDVFNYNEDGTIADTEGTWLAGKERPPAMIMPAAPKVGDVYRSENIPGLVFEEVTVKSIGQTVDGPHGPVAGAIVGEELHDDGSHEDKTFAPGYGEFFTGGGGDVEALALAVPSDALQGAPPAELESLLVGAADVFDQVRAKQWRSASATVRKMNAAWKKLQAGEAPPRLAVEMTRALRALDRGVDARQGARAANGAIDVAQSALDLVLRRESPTEIDIARFELWARQVLVDAAAGNLGGVTGDVATLEWIRDRFAHALDPVDVTRMDVELLALRRSVGDEDLDAAAAAAGRLRKALLGVGR